MGVLNMGVYYMFQMDVLKGLPRRLVDGELEGGQLELEEALRLMELEETRCRGSSAGLG